MKAKSKNPDTVITVNGTATVRAMAFLLGAAAQRRRRWRVPHMSTRNNYPEGLTHAIFSPISKATCDASISKHTLLQKQLFLALL